MLSPFLTRHCTVATRSAPSLEAARAFAIICPALAGETDAKKVEDSLAATAEKDTKEAAKEAMRLRIEASKKNYRPASRWDS
mmetsp:Transcript_22542/g.42368  ORF Transcript_22542/g.42368 Transcript_22542/m.42368 type:complete len:82 (+) Transcript_22542:165-410(+)